MMNKQEILKQYFGYDNFRIGQEEIIDNILRGKDILAIMPTGAGKSICYQIPAMILEGITIVISPLISLMQDQVKALNNVGIRSAYINSSLTQSQYEKALQLAYQGIYKIIYVAPERLENDEFITFAKTIKISMLTIDEAHCISQWGQDFRPAYLKIIQFISNLDYRPIISAFTATATKQVSDDINNLLTLNNPFRITTGFDRKNLYFKVVKPKSKDNYVLNYINNHPNDSGIIYCSTRKNVDNLYDLLVSQDFKVAKYHAGMSSEQRKIMQDDFIFDNVNIIVATNAFGMGIDKSNVRYVLHYNMPQSMENYYQEAGRAGRDGLESNCILLFSVQDIIINKFLLSNKDFTDIDHKKQKPIIQQDKQRLLLMENYCKTNLCLRNYILKYFGENPQEDCNNCANCNENFISKDMTFEAKQLINCAFESKGNFNKNQIIQVVLGLKPVFESEQFTLNLKSYAKLQDNNAKDLNFLIDYLIKNDYLKENDFKISVGNIENLKEEICKILIKIPNEYNEENEEFVPKIKVKNNEKDDILDDYSLELFEKLRILRLEFSKKEKMPPYIIFADKTLIEMSKKMPISENEFRQISGVGKHKIIKYGEDFINLILDFVKEKKLKKSKNLFDNQEVIKKMSYMEKSKLENKSAYQPWSEQEDKQLEDECINKNMSIRQMAEIHNRTFGAIRSRLVKLGFIEN